MKTQGSIPNDWRNQAWRLTMEGKYQEALALYTPHILAMHGAQWNNYGILMMLLGRYAEAYQAFATAPKNTNPQLGFDPVTGVALWALGRKQEVYQLWAAAYQPFIYARTSGDYLFDAGGVNPLLLLYAFGVIEDNTGYQEYALDELREVVQTEACQKSRFPGSTARYLLGSISSEQLLKEVQTVMSDSPVLGGRFECQAYFYMALNALKRDDIPTALSFLTQSADNSLLREKALQTEFYFAHALIKMQYSQI